jgi:hypothetical protein
MKKFFLFNREGLSPSSSDSSDTGVGLSVLAIPSDHLSFITALEGAVNITFNDASLYEGSGFFEGEALKKTSVTVSCRKGNEVSLIESIIGFISSDVKSGVMRFDVVSNKSTFSAALVDSPDSIKSKIFDLPIVMSSGKPSKGSDSEVYQNTIADIHFGEGNLPILDYNHEALAPYSDGDEITAWANAGTGGVTYSIVANVSTPSAEVSSATSDSNKKAALCNLGEHFIVPNSFTVRHDYTLYCVLGTAIPPMALYGDAAGETVGFGGVYPESNDLNENNVRPKSNSFSVRHSGMTGAVATTQTDNSEDGTVDYDWPDYQVQGRDTAKSNIDIFIIRRDLGNNMYLHNRNGNIIGFIPAKGGKGLLTTDPYRTDGDLLIERLSTVKDNTSGGAGKYRGHISRFGVIEHDIGPSKASKLATDLFELYKTTT